jgi:dienelactone hydrolase
MIKCIFLRFAILLAMTGNAWVSAHEMRSIQVQTAFAEADQAVTLELVYRKPLGDGPFPTLLFTHGSTNNGSDHRELRFTASYPELSEFLNDRGWLVVLLQRRGRGKSGGTYSEGWDASLGKYACEHEVAISGQQRALADMDAAYAHLARDPLVDPNRILVGGNSRGGLLALMHAAYKPHSYVGAINFVGGWAGQRCNLMQDINARALTHAGSFSKPTLWFYGERDPYYPAGYGSTLFKQFESVGGLGTLHTVTYGPLRNDHLIVRAPSLWGEYLSSYLVQFGGHK